MSKRKLTPLATALILVDSLSPEEIATLADYLRGKLPQTPRRPKSIGVPGAGKRSPRSKSADESKANTEAGMGSASVAAVCVVPKCGHPEGDPVHRYGHPDYHLFHATIKTKGVGV